MSSAGLLLISKVIEEGDIDSVIKLGLKEEHLDSNRNQEMWKWLVEQTNMNGRVPTERQLKREWADVSFPDASDETFKGLVRELHTSYMDKKYLDIRVEMAQRYGEGTNKDLQEQIRDAALSLLEISTSVTFFSGLDPVRDYENVLKDLRERMKLPKYLKGLPTDIDSLDMYTGGLRKGTLNLIYAENKRGKTMLATIMANAAHEHGVHVLYISYEMLPEEMQDRWLAYIAGVGMNKVTTDFITNNEFGRISKKLTSKKYKQSIKFIDGAQSGRTVSDVAALIRQHQPGFVVLDAAYLMRDSRAGKSDNKTIGQSNIADDLMVLARESGIPILVTLQALSSKVSNKTTRELDSSTIGWSNAWVNNCHWAVAVERNTDDPTGKTSVLRLTTNRSGEQGVISMNWDWETMDFSEMNPPRNLDKEPAVPTEESEEEE